MDHLIKRLIWLYLFLLIGEGILRKWVLPGLSEPLLIIRDPLVIGIYLCAFINTSTRRALRYSHRLPLSALDLHHGGYF